MHHYCVDMLARLFLIVICLEALLSQIYVSGSKHDYYTLQNRHGDGEKNIPEQVTHQLTRHCSDLWFTPRNGTCHCGSTLDGIVTCNEQTKEVMVLDCYCMTTDSTNQTVVGACLYNSLNLTHNTVEYQDHIYHQTPSDCRTHLHRNGTFVENVKMTFSLVPIHMTWTVLNALLLTAGGQLHICLSQYPLQLYLSSESVLFLLNFTRLSPLLR